MDVLQSVETLEGFTVGATDGEIGHVKDVYFDDLEWTIRQLVVDTGGWLSGRKVLLSPASIQAADWANRVLRVKLTRQQVQDSPDINTARPVSRQHESSLYDYYGYPYYWAGPYLWGYTVFPTLVEQQALQDKQDQELRGREGGEGTKEDAHLRSANEVLGYGIHATDGEIGHVEDLLFDQRNWKIERMVVDTRNWWPGKQVLITPERIAAVRWEDRSVDIRATRQQIEHSPEYDRHHPPLVDSPQDFISRARGT